MCIRYEWNYKILGTMDGYGVFVKILGMELQVLRNLGIIKRVLIISVTHKVGDCLFNLQVVHIQGSFPGMP